MSVIQMGSWIYCTEGMSCVKFSPAGGGSDRDIATADQK